MAPSLTCMQRGGVNKTQGQDGAEVTQEEGHPPSMHYPRSLETGGDWGLWIKHLQHQWEGLEFSSPAPM